MKRATAAIVAKSAGTSGGFDLLLSTAATDRDGDTLTADKWATPLPESIPLNVDHDRRIGSVVGSGVPSIENGQLRVRGTFANTDDAQRVRSLVNDGHVKSVSVEYLESADGTRELIGGAFVCVPANKEARVLSSKSATDPAPGDAVNDVDPDTVFAVALAVVNLHDTPQADVQAAVDAIRSLLDEIAPEDESDDVAAPDGTVSEAPGDSVKSASARARAKAWAILESVS